MFTENWSSQCVKLHNVLAIASNEHINIKIMRHAKTEYNEKKMIQGFKMQHVPITSHGLYALEVINKLKIIDSRKFEKVWCSPALRAVQTAALCNQYKIELLDELHEVDWGYIDGASQHTPGYAIINDKWLIDHEIDFKLYGGESLNQLLTRINSAIKQIVDDAIQNNLQDILVVGHGFWFAMLLSMINKTMPSLDCKLSNCESLDIRNFYIKQQSDT